MRHKYERGPNLEESPTLVGRRRGFCMNVGIPSHTEYAEQPGAMTQFPQPRQAHKRNTGRQLFVFAGPRFAGLGGRNKCHPKTDV